MRTCDQRWTPASMLRSHLETGSFTPNEVMANLASEDEGNDTLSNADKKKKANKLGVKELQKLRNKNL